MSSKKELLLLLGFSKTMQEKQNKILTFPASSLRNCDDVKEMTPKTDAKS